MPIIIYQQQRGLLHRYVPRRALHETNTLLGHAYSKLRRACAQGDGIAALDAIARGVEGFRPSEAALHAASGRDFDSGFGTEWLTEPVRQIA